MFRSAFSKTQLQKKIRRWKRQKNHLIVLVGKRKAGKDVFVDYVMKNYSGFKHYRFADGPDLIAKVLNLPIERRIQHALFGVNTLLYPFLGESAYKRRVAKLLDGEKPKFALVEAVRTEEEYKEFVVNRGGILVGIEAEDKIRYVRALADSGCKGSKQDEGKMTFKQFMAKEKFPLERQVKRIIRRAHFILKNDFPKKSPFYREAELVMAELGIHKRGR